jgi:cell division protein FtsN
LKTDLFRGKVESTTMNPLLTAEFENNKKAVDEVNNNIAGYPILSDSTTTINEKTIEPEIFIPAVTESNPYVVITGSFKSRENADLQLNTLIGDGYSPEIVTTDNGFYRVCAIACNDIKTANSKKDSIAKKFPGTWVSKNK